MSQTEITQAGNEVEPAEVPPGPPARGRSVTGSAERWGLVAFLVLLFVLFSVLPGTSGSFLTSANMRGLSANEVVVVVVALAGLPPLISGEFDISIGAIVGLVAYIIPYLSHHAGIPTVPAIILGLVIGVLAGVVNGVLIAYVGANSLIVTLGMQTFLGGLLLFWSGGTIITDVPQSLANFGGDSWVGIPAVVWCAVVVILVLGYVVRYTLFGRKITFVGANYQAARLVGMDTKRIRLLCYVTSATVASVGGLLLLCRSGVGDPAAGPDYTLSALAAAFLGATSISPGRFNIAGTVVGVLFVGVAVNGLTLLGVQSWVQPVFNGSAVVVAVAIAALLSKKRGRA